ncbi:PREDICTED: uncharacterized protein LOC104594458 [Nelumbo nucifera]|uniref:Uncharacterized protein LOC104594458 n=1 Tax=Nelumbo nucifera TaxID=4432 RepID=A0A1U7ZGY2_NELNU|nr:PREDICTED: uncharacterized protein LOC104594458 [Nelumbo nucifera]
MATSMRRFNSFIEALELKEIMTGQNRFTWTNCQESPILSKLDRFLVTQDWEDHWGNLISRILPRLTSDHWPICLNQEGNGGGPKPFWFEDMWLTVPSFVQKVRNWWEEDTSVARWEGIRFHRKLKNLKGKLKEWNSNQFGRIEERKSTLISRIEEIDRREEEGQMGMEEKERTNLKKELEATLLREEISWKQKSRERWIKEGDGNTRYFHAIANGRRRKNFISMLELESGATITQQDDIAKALVDHFKLIYRRPMENRWILEGLTWPALDSTLSRELEKGFEMEDVKAAIFSMDRSKAPGLDGFTMAF